MRTVRSLERGMRYRKQMIGEAVEQIKTVNPKEIEAMISNNLQVLVTKQVIPKITQFVNEMKIKMNSSRNFPREMNRPLGKFHTESP